MGCGVKDVELEDDGYCWGYRLGHRPVVIRVIALWNDWSAINDLVAYQYTLMNAKSYSTWDS